MDVFPSILEFGKAVFDLSTTLYSVGGGLLLVLLRRVIAPLYWRWRLPGQAVKLRPLRPSTYLAYALACILVAAFHEWHDANARLAALTLPNLRMTIDQTTVTTNDPPDSGGGHVVYSVSIANLGAPSTCQDWAIHIIDQNMNLYRYRPTYVPPEGMTMRMPDPTLHFPQASLISERVATEPIPNNGREVGYLIVMNAMPPAVLTSVLTRHQVHCTDIRGNAVSAEFVFPNSRGEPFRVIPGIGVNVVRGAAN